MGMNEGFDVGMEMSGQQSALEGMMDFVNMGGKVAMLAST